MADEWWYAKGSDKHGPVSSRELRELANSGALQPTDLIWKEGAPEWRPASIVRGLFSERRATPPPLPDANARKKSTHDTYVDEPRFTIEPTAQYNDDLAEAAWKSRYRPDSGSSGLLDVFLKKTIKQITYRHKSRTHKKSPTGMSIDRDYLIGRLRDLYKADGFQVTAFDSALVTEKIRTGADYFVIKTGNDPFATASSHENSIIRIIDHGDCWTIDLSTEGYFWPRIADQLLGSMGMLCLALIFFSHVFA